MATDKDIENAVLSVFPDTEYNVIFSNRGGGFMYYKHKRQV